MIGYDLVVLHRQAFFPLSAAETNPLTAYPSTELLVKGIRKERNLSVFFSLHGGAHYVTGTELLRLAFARCTLGTVGTLAPQI
jgi:hypothetical protein